MGKILGTILLAAGVLLSLVLLAVEFRIRRRTGPYESMNRISPELHAPLALLSGAGAWMTWGWPSGLAVALGHGLLFMFIATKLR